MAGLERGVERGAERGAERGTEHGTGSVTQRERVMLHVTHGERVVDAASSTTKLGLLRYFQGAAAWLLPQLQGRAVSLLRAPGGVGQTAFFQKHAGQAAIPHIHVLDPALWPGRAALLEIDDEAALLGAAQMNVVEFHTWGSRLRRIGHPDRMVFDLDPGAGVGWPAICSSALQVRDLLQRLGLHSWLKTSGGKGLHVVVPLAPRYGFANVKAFAKGVALQLEREAPGCFVSTSGPTNRVGRIFVDYLRNGEGATTVAAYSPRARPGLGVSMPVNWADLPRTDGAAHWHVGNTLAHLARRRRDPWADLDGTRQPLGAALKQLKALQAG